MFIIIRTVAGPRLIPVADIRFAGPGPARNTTLIELSGEPIACEERFEDFVKRLQRIVPVAA